MGKGWTPERRAKQAEAIRRWKPWEKSTGPRTEEGKEASKYNALKHYMRCAEEVEARKQFNAVMRRAAAYIRHLDEQKREHRERERERKRQLKAM